MKRGSIFELDGVPRLREAAPLFWSPYCRWYRSSCNGASGPADKGVFSASDHGNCCIYHRSFSLSNSY